MELLVLVNVVVKLEELVKQLRMHQHLTYQCLTYAIRQQPSGCFNTYLSNGNIMAITKVEYMNKLLTLCTDGEQEKFNKMYPQGPTKKQIDWAIKQIENTINAQSRIRSMENIRQHKTKVEEQDKQIRDLQKQLANINDQLNQVNNENMRLRQVTTSTAVDVAERLDKLAALEACGVDNWDGYDVAMEGAGSSY